MEYYLAIKRNEIMTFAATWMALEIIMLSEVRQWDINIICCHLYRESKKRIQQTSLQKRNTLRDFDKLMVTKGCGGAKGWAGGLGWKCCQISLWWWLYDYKYNKIYRVKKNFTVFIFPLKRTSIICGFLCRLKFFSPRKLQPKLKTTLHMIPWPCSFLTFLNLKTLTSTHPSSTYSLDTAWGSLPQPQPWEIRSILCLLATASKTIVHTLHTC